METLKLKIEEFFSGMTFQEGEHKYFVEGKELSMSVSGLIKKYKYPTNWNIVLHKTAEARGQSKEDVKKEWSEAAEKGCTKGNMAHLFGELYPYNRDLIPQTGMDKAIKAFWEDLPEHIVPLFLELKMYHKKFMFAGTGDIILYNTKTGKIIIGDYKTNKDLFKNYNNQKMTRGFSDLYCCNFNHYQLQLSYYQILLEQILKPLGIEIASRKIIWLKDDGSYEIYDTKDYTEELLKDLNTIGVC